MAHEKPYEILAENIPITPDDDEYVFERYTTMDIIRLTEKCYNELIVAIENELSPTPGVEYECGVSEFEREWLRDKLGLIEKDAWMPGDTSVHYWFGMEDFYYGNRVVRIYREVRRNV